MKTIIISILVFLFGFLAGEYFPDRPDYAITIENGVVEVTDGGRYVGSGDLTEVEEIILKDKER